MPTPEDVIGLVERLQAQRDELRELLREVAAGYRQTLGPGFNVALGPEDAGKALLVVPTDVLSRLQEAAGPS